MRFVLYNYNSMFKLGGYKMGFGAPTTIFFIKLQIFISLCIFLGKDILGKGMVSTWFSDYRPLYISVKRIDIYHYAVLKEMK